MTYTCPYTVAIDQRRHPEQPDRFGSDRSGPGRHPITASEDLPMAEVSPITRTESLANPFRLGNGSRRRFLAAWDGLLAEFERCLGEAHPVHANWMLTGIRGTGKTVSWASLRSVRRAQDGGASSASSVTAIATRIAWWRRSTPTVMH